MKRGTGGDGAGEGLTMQERRGLAYYESYLRQARATFGGSISNSIIMLAAMKGIPVPDRVGGHDNKRGVAVESGQEGRGAGADDHSKAQGKRWIEWKAKVEGVAKLGDDATAGKLVKMHEKEKAAEMPKGESKSKKTSTFTVDQKEVDKQKQKLLARGKEILIARKRGKGLEPKKRDKRAVKAALDAENQLLIKQKEEAWLHNTTEGQKVLAQKAAFKKLSEKSKVETKGPAKATPTASLIDDASDAIPPVAPTAPLTAPLTGGVSDAIPPVTPTAPLTAPPTSDGGVVPPVAPTSTSKTISEFLLDNAAKLDGREDEALIKMYAYSKAHLRGGSENITRVEETDKPGEKPKEEPKVETKGPAKVAPTATLTGDGGVVPPVAPTADIDKPGEKPKGTWVKTVRTPGKKPKEEAWTVAVGTKEERATRSGTDVTPPL